MNVFTILFLSFKQFISFIAYGVSFLFPRRKTLWIYGNLKGTFRDNAKYFFIYNSIHYTNIHHVWISQSKEVVADLRKMGLKAVYKFSPLAFWYALTAKVYIYNAAPTDTVHGCLRGTAYCFNLWHGIPFKKIEYDIKKGSFYKRFFNPIGWRQKFESFLFEPKLFRNSDGVLATSEKLKPIFRSAFKIGDEKVFIGPYPRNEVFKMSVTELLDYINNYEKDEIKEWVKKMCAFESVLIYMPTFRDENPDFMDKAISDFAKLNEVCARNNTLFMIKAHMLTRFNVNLTGYSHIALLDNHIDVYPLLPLTHALISDYSSIIFDYSLMHKKILFYAYDIDEYLCKSRESYFNYKDVFSDNIIGNFEELIMQLNELNLSSKYEYPTPLTFLQNDKTLADITAHIYKMANK